MQAGSGRGVSALIISPTRELAQQIATEANQLGKFHQLNVQVIPCLPQPLGAVDITHQHEMRPKPGVTASNA